MRSHDDMLLESVFKSEVALTPQWLRLSRTKKLITYVTETALIGMMLYSMSPESGSFISKPLALAVLTPFAVLLPIWFIKALREEIKAYETASYIVEQRKKKEVTKYANHVDYCDAEDFKPIITQPARFCPHCGFVLTPGENSCKTCGRFNIWKNRNEDMEVLMKKQLKRKAGFTLIETILVVAIIVILVPLLLFGATGYLNKAHNAAASMSIHNSNVQTAVAEIEDAI